MTNQSVTQAQLLKGIDVVTDYLAAADEERAFNGFEPEWPAANRTLAAAEAALREWLEEVKS